MATNASGDRLAVTAGHCADEVEQKVYGAGGDLIGIVAHHSPDDFTANTWGVTLIALADNTYTADAKFSSFGDPVLGDYVTKYGFRTDRTEGTIAAISADAKQPWKGTMSSTLVGLPGDSGAAWIGVQDGALKLLGLNVGYTTRPDGGYGMAAGFPIRELVALVNRNSPAFGRGFIPVGR
ncbi:S1 family peptidase [Mycobacteroides abscessus]|uniref:S1 family peptidase n=1 Tax=Mycobacteroides abscessus TaxID=36809 RepID=UPI001F2FB35E|nr:S1 family peptidase [Mycobacteroides abscessus]